MENHNVKLLNLEMSAFDLELHGYLLVEIARCDLTLITVKKRSHLYQKYIQQLI